jgi:hypothetical protein
MPALTDSRWVAEDLAASVPPRGTLTVSTDVQGFGPDINDPDISASSGEASKDWGTRTAWGKLVLADERAVTLDVTDSDDAANLLIVVWSVSEAGALAPETDSWGDVPLEWTLAAGTYLVEFCRPGRTVFAPASVSTTSAAPTATRTTGRHVDDAAVSVTATEPTVTYERSA